MFKSIFRSIFPPACQVCFRPLVKDYYQSFLYKNELNNYFGQVVDSKYLCSRCLYRLRERKHEDRYRLIEDCLIIIAFYYNDLLAWLIRRYKFKQEPLLARVLVEQAEPVLREAIDDLKNKKILHNKLIAGYALKKIKILLPIPLHNQRQKERGFNQAELIARSLEDKKTFFFLKDILVRTKNTQRQTEVKLKWKRAENLKDAFQVQQLKDKLVERIIKQKCSIILVDDLITSGETIFSAYRCLKQQGYKSIFGLCISSGQ